MNPDRALELKVGIFVAIGLAVIGGFVLKFGRLGEGFKIYYDLTIRFKDASGLLKGSDVVLSGAKIGRVSGGPRLLGEGVAVPLRIYEYVKLPKGSQFTVGSSGLLGDRFVNVITPAAPAKEYLPKARELIKAHGGQLLAAGGAGGSGNQVIAVDGEPPKRVVVYRYPSVDAVHAWHDDPAYQEVRKIGEKYAKYRTFAVEGVSQ